MRFGGFFSGVSGLVLANLGAAIAAPGAVSAQTTIEVDQEAGFDTGTNVTATEGTFTISGGEASGANLFHSFAEFNLASGDIAQWVRGQSDAAAIEHVINRVRSGSPSQIDGTIRLTDMPNADFWFVNPAGVIFGANAALDVPGAAHFSTAQEIGFGGGERFSTVTPDGSTFSSAPPQAFGFLGGSEDILVEAGFGLREPDVAPQSLTLVAADIGLEGGHVFAQSEVALIALGDAPLGQVAFADQAPLGTGEIVFSSPTGERGSLELSGGQNLLASASTIRLSDFDIVSGSGAGGTMAFVADRLTLETSSIQSLALVEGQSTDILINAGTVDLSATDPDPFSTPIAIFSVTETGAAGANIEINAGSLLMSGALIATETNGEGAGGNISISALESIELVDAARIEVRILGPGSGGSIAIDSPLTELRSDAALLSSIFDGATGTSGAIDISGGTLLLDRATIFSNTSPGPDGLDGTINIALEGDLALSNESLISGSSFSERDAGNIGIEAENVTITGSAILSDTDFEANGGIIVVIARQDFIARTSVVASDTSGPGNAGGVLISAERVLIADETIVQSNASSLFSGEAGVVIITGNERVRIESGASVSASTISEKDAGVILINTGTFELSAAEIRSITSFGGNAGQISIVAQDATLTEGALVLSQAVEGSSGMAGGVSLQVTGDLVLEQAALSASTEGAGAAGDIMITADTLTIDRSGIGSSSSGDFALGAAGNIEINTRVFDGRDANITSFTFGPAPAGIVEITADEFFMTSGRIDSASDAFAEGGDAGGVLIAARTAVLREFAQIDSRTNSGLGGAVLLVVSETLDIADDAFVSASTSGTGQAGIVGITAGRLLMSGGSITSDALGAGNAGGVFVVANDLVMSGGRIDSSSISPLAEAGMAGSVEVNVMQASISGDAFIESSGVTGNAGDVSLIVENSLSIADDATVSAQTSGSGAAGIVNVSAAALAMSGGTITSRSLGSGAAGTVNVKAGELAMTGGEIGSSASNIGDAGNVEIEAVNASLTGPALIDSETLDGSSGNAGSVSLAVANTLVMTGGAEISTTVRGGDDAGGIAIAAPTILLDGNSVIASEAAGMANAGGILIFAERLTVANGSAITTDSENGPAGAIGLFFPEEGVLRLDGLEPGVITTSSGANTGGLITIANPSLILSTGGSILALGEQGGANVEITSQFFIRSSDRLNEVSVDGSLVLDSQVGEQIAATPPVDLGFLDASGILSGQCAPARQGEGQSRFSSRITGPYALPPARAPVTAGEPQSSAPAERTLPLASLSVCR